MGSEEQPTTPPSKFVVAVRENGHVKTIGGPYRPQKAREVRKGMLDHVDRGHYRTWNIPEDTDEVRAVTRDELRVLRGFEHAE
jgi:hypothetical protein